MSHFTVGVLIKEGEKNLEELLAPYQENNMGDCPKEYLEFYDRTEEVLDYYEDHKEEYDSIEEFAEDYFGYEKCKDSYGYWENPNAKWDWYVVGGRWGGMLLDKQGNRIDACKLKDIDWKAMYEEAKKEAEERWDNSEGIHRFFAGIHRDDTRESYIKRQSEFSTYAVITPDGEWHSQGSMGWFGVSSETEDEAKEWNLSFYDRFIKEADQDLFLVIVDCHI